jgi:outer membrane immunogenic protein
MKKFLLAGVAAVALASGAQAADLGVRRGAVAEAIIAPVFSWTGFYVGVHAGYGFGQSTPTNIALVAFPTSYNGGLIGGQIGFNYQINQIVLGAEADLAYTAIGGHNPGGGGITVRNMALGSLRARAGYAFDRSLLYVTGGLGFQRASFATTAGPEPYTRTGWTIGAGWEYAITQNVTAKIEYNYYNFGTRTLGPIYTGTVNNAHIHTVKVGLNYLFSTGPSAVVARY